MLKKYILFSLVVFLYAENLDEASVFDMMQRDGTDKFIKNKPSQTSEYNKIDEHLDKDQIDKRDIINLNPTDEPDLNIPEYMLYDTIKKKDIILKVSEMPKEVIVGEIFKIDISVNIQSNFDFEFVSELDETNLNWLNKNSIQWVKYKDSENYIATFYIQVKNTKAKSTSFNLKLIRNEEVFQEGNMNIFLPKLKQLKTQNDYNNIVADLLEVKKFKTTKFDDTNNIMIVELYGKNINMASFYIDNKNIIKQGVDTIAGDFGSQSAYYFAVFKPNKKTLDFSYYNLVRGKFDSFSLPVSIEDDEISTQIGLNPKQSDIVFYKNSVIYILGLIFFIIFLIKRKVIYFILFLIFAAIGFYSYNPFRNAVLNKNVNVKILPTINSTIFYTTQTDENVEILLYVDDYVKVLFHDGKIGWVKKDDIIKN
ncbi:SH3 domain-containing protein [Campylobacter pinnipediorum]|uniref:Periplasmic protein n=1 Tax=Campylobacter pinnipediorum subsp. pinnipediorum TaxID=1660067 RepID=A0AAX0LA97_9BACT|nr:SH3 domain-containing protein [Campylobacter pinnipediorum]AQW82729.1 hypothetical protein CPIN17261_0716 [Campylobacter pinnipediorum subsp. pinnipediorum]OPA77903.1 hypothetical protein BFG04_03010 [Campylobacter pinnipediorum subsp. pinnipediorum]OPA78063.1 hypothetical protein BFG05_02300 [Campylobacter pinnipediorum subsp. pinnipediorum]